MSIILGDTRPKRGGWAPGAYMGRKCNRCGCEFIGDNRAVTCAPCAYAEHHAVVDATPPRCLGACLMADNKAAVLLLFGQPVTPNQLRAIHDHFKEKWN